MSINLENDGW